MRVRKTTIEDNGFDLKLALEELGMSQREFAKHTSIEYYNINRYINGLPCTERQAKIIADAYNKLVEPNPTEKL